MASALYRTGNVERAEKVYRDSLKQHPYNAQILNDLAWILQERDQDNEGALELGYQKAYKQDKNEGNERNE